jgi:enoyl-CoA hydratase
MGTRKAKELLFTADWWTAEDARQMGMVNHVVPRAELASFTLAMAEKIAAKPSMGLKLTKEAVNQTVEAQGQWQAMLAVFNLHQLAHSHNMQVHGMPMDPGWTSPAQKKPTA